MQDVAEASVLFMRRRHRIAQGALQIFFAPGFCLRPRDDGDFTYGSTAHFKNSSIRRFRLAVPG